MIEVNYKKKGGVYTFSVMGGAEDPYGACASILALALDIRIRALVEVHVIEIKRQATAAQHAYFVEFAPVGGDEKNAVAAHEMINTIMTGFTWLAVKYPEHVKLNAEVEQA